MDDMVLVRHAVEGNDQAFRALVERYEGVVAATVIRMLGSGDDADDVGQETFIRFHKALRKFRGDASLRTYLTRIAMNLSLNALKRRKRFRSRFVSRDQSEAPMQEPGTNGEREQDAWEVREAVDQALGKLAPKYRAVVVLRMIEGYSTRETAEILGVPQGTVLSRLSRGLEALKPLLERYRTHYGS